MYFLGILKSRILFFSFHATPYLANVLPMFLFILRARIGCNHQSSSSFSSSGSMIVFFYNLLIASLDKLDKSPRKFSPPSVRFLPIADSVYALFFNLPNPKMLWPADDYFFASSCKSVSIFSSTTISSFKSLKPTSSWIVNNELSVYYVLSFIFYVTYFF